MYYYFEGEGGRSGEADREKQINPRRRLSVGDFLQKAASVSGKLTNATTAIDNALQVLAVNTQQPTQQDIDEIARLEAEQKAKEARQKKIIITVSVSLFFVLIAVLVISKISKRSFDV